MERRQDWFLCMFDRQGWRHLSLEKQQPRQYQRNRPAPAAVMFDE
ncbi:MAG TPA: hypothetical protein VGS05_16140 [Candidatus Sulfotelmatobacter sp.]|nr:hypothetical protein [Candidatus Sulfotelmatobacter sp.]